MVGSKKWFSKIVLIIFLLLVVIGFTVPLFNLGGEEENAGYAEPRLCQADPDCYLNCGETPVKVICLQNLCGMNSCEEYNPYPYQEEPLRFSLSVEVEGKAVDLSLHSHPLDLFTKFSNHSVDVYTSELPLGRILEKAGISMDSRCLTVSSEEYCLSEGEKRQLTLNEEEFYGDNFYAPQEGDIIEIKYANAAQEKVLPE